MSTTKTLEPCKSGSERPRRRHIRRALLAAGLTVLVSGIAFAGGKSTLVHKNFIINPMTGDTLIEDGDSVAVHKRSHTMLDLAGDPVDTSTTEQETIQPKKKYVIIPGGIKVPLDDDKEQAKPKKKYMLDFVGDSIDTSTTDDTSSNSKKEKQNDSSSEEIKRDWSTF
jgi:hypothetical protein